MLPFQGLAWTLALTTTVRPSFTAASSLLDFLGSLTPLCPRGPSARTRHGGGCSQGAPLQGGQLGSALLKEVQLPGGAATGRPRSAAPGLRPPASLL